MQVSAKKHVKLAKYGCLRCGRYLFAPTWYKLYYNVMVCNCDASHFKASSVDVPDHVQAYWDAQFSTTSHSYYRRRLKRWTKRYLPAEILYEDAFAIQDVHIPDVTANSLRIKEALNVLSGRKLGTSIKARFAEVNTARFLHREHFFENIVNYTKARHVAKDRFAEDDPTILVDNHARARP